MGYFTPAHVGGWGGVGEGCSAVAAAVASAGGGGVPKLTKNQFIQDWFAWSGKRSQTPWEYFAAYQGSPAAI